MNASAYPHSSPLGDFAAPPPILIAASSDEARRRAAVTVEAAGFRIAAVAVDQAIERLNNQAAASAL